MYTVLCISETIVMQHKADSVYGGYTEDWEGDAEKLFRHVLYQETIKVREWIPHVGPLTKIIPLKLF